MMRLAVAALLVIITGLECTEPRAESAPPPGCPTERQCADLCWAAEDENPWDCIDACMSDDDECFVKEI